MSDIAAASPPAEILERHAPLVTEVDVPCCEVCGRDDTDPVAWGYDYELLTCSNRWRFVSCRACGHVWLSPRPGIDALDTIYPSTYYAYNYGDIPALARKGKELLDARKLGQILGRCGSLPTRYLDVGCGDGRYLEVLARRGVERHHLSGLELDADAVDAARRRGFDVHRSQVETFDFPAASFDLITMFNVIEHVESPSAVLAKLAGWLRPGAILAVETPNLDSWDADLFRAGWWGGYHIPRHWHLFTPATIDALVTRTGLAVDDVRFETGHAFWMYSFHHCLRYGRRAHPRLARFFDPFRSMVPLIALTAFDRVRALLGARTSSMLVIARKPL